MRETTAVAFDAAGRDVVERTWAAVAGPGSFFTGGERLVVAQTARAARSGLNHGRPMSAVMTDATRRVASEAMSIRPEMIEVWSAGGLDRLAYVELVSVVARVVAIDAYLAALGQPPRPLPVARPGEPDPFVDATAEISTGWVPTVGPAQATASLSALPREAAGAEAVSDALYLSYAGVADLRHDPLRPISRPQMELVASRVSWLNECFY
jgi:hypothetical protein